MIRRETARTIHEEPVGAYRSDDHGNWYVLNLVLSDLHGAYMPVIQSGPHETYNEAYHQGTYDNVREGSDPIRFAPEVTVVEHARAFSIQNLTLEEVRRYKEREQWLLEPMIVPVPDEQHNLRQRTIERPFA